MTSNPLVDPEAAAGNVPKNASREDGVRKITASEAPLREPEDPKKVAGSDPGTADADADVDQGVMPHATISAAKVAGDLAKGVKTVIDEAIEWTEKKVDELTVDKEEGVGPYASPATCVPSELDPIASGVMPAMEAEKSKENAEQEAEKSRGKQADDATNDEPKRERLVDNEKR